MHRSLLKDDHGTSVVEISLIAPLLLTMSIGAFDLSQLVGRRTQLQEVTAEVSFIAMAAIANNNDEAELELNGNAGSNPNNGGNSENNNKTDLDDVRTIAAASAGIDVDQVTLTRKEKCGTNGALLTGTAACNAGEEKSTFIEIAINDTFTPNWANFGVGDAVPIQVVRLVQVD